VTVICSVALGVALFAATLVDRSAEASGRSALAREAQGFAVALQGRSNDVLRYLPAKDRGNPQAIQEIRDVLRQLGPGAELMVSRITIEPGGTTGSSQIEVVQPTRRGPIAEAQLKVSWVRTPEGEWKADVLRP
jgi:hypothetical protein